MDAAFVMFYLYTKEIFQLLSAVSTSKNNFEHDVVMKILKDDEGKLYIAFTVQSIFKLN